MNTTKDAPHPRASYAEETVGCWSGSRRRYVEHSVVTAVSSLVSFYNFRLCKL